MCSFNDIYLYIWTCSQIHNPLGHISRTMYMHECLSPLLSVLHMVGKGPTTQKQLHSIQITVITGPVECGFPLNKEINKTYKSQTSRYTVLHTVYPAGQCMFSVLALDPGRSYLLVLDIGVCIMLNEQGHAVDVASICRTLEGSPSCVVLKVRTDPIFH